MADGDDESSRTLWVGNLHEKVTEEILFELFLQAGPLERVVLPSGKRYAFITFQHKESVPYSKELMDGVQLFGQYLKMQPRTQSSNSNNTAYQTPAPMMQPEVQHLMSPARHSLPGYQHGQQMYGIQYNQYTNAAHGMMQPDVQRLVRLQEDVKRQLSHLSSMTQPQQPHQRHQHQQQYQHQQQSQQNYRQHGTQQWANQGRRGYH